MILSAVIALVRVSHFSDIFVAPYSDNHFQSTVPRPILSNQMDPVLRSQPTAPRYPTGTTPLAPMEVAYHVCVHFSLNF